MPDKLKWERICNYYVDCQPGAKERWIADGEFWLKILLGTFIAVCSSIALVTFILPYGGGGY